MRKRIAEVASLIFCLVLLLVIPLVVAIIVASPFAAYHVVLHGWKAGWIDLKESSYFIGYSWALLIGAALLWSLITFLWDRKNDRTVPVSQEP